MPRLTPQSKAEVAKNPLAVFLYERKFGSMDAPEGARTATGAPGNAELVFGRSAGILEHITRGFALWRNDMMDLPPLLRELAVARVGWACGAQFVFSQHCKVLRAVGASEEQVTAIPSWPVAGCFDDHQRAVLAFADSLAYDHGRTPDAVFAALQEFLSDQEIVELTYIASMYVMHAGMIRALRMEYDDRPEPVVEVPAPTGFSEQAMLESRLSIPG